MATFGLTLVPSFSIEATTDVQNFAWFLKRFVPTISAAKIMHPIGHFLE